MLASRRLGEVGVEREMKWGLLSSRKMRDGREEDERVLLPRSSTW
jgi:hypothetical protein